MNGCCRGDPDNDPGEADFRVKVQNIWWFWQEGWLSTKERIVLLKAVEAYESARVEGPTQKIILEAGVRLYSRLFERGKVD